MTLLLIATAWLLTYLVHSTLLLGGAWTLSRLGIVRAPAARDVLWKVALVGGLLTATVQIGLNLRPVTGQVSLSVAAESQTVDAFADVGAGLPGGQAVRRSGGQEMLASDVMSEPAEAEFTPAPRRVGAFHLAYSGLVLNFWLFGALACGIRLYWARRELRRRLEGRRDVEAGPLADALAGLAREAGYTRRVRLTVSDTISGPISFGANEICLPSRASAGLGGDEQRAVLAHELGHLVRRDPRWQLAAAVIGAVLFFQPLNRLARRRLQELAEYLCDDFAAARAGGGLVLAKCLAEVAGWMRHQPEMATVPGMAARPSQLVARVQRLLNGEDGSGVRGARGTVAVLSIGVLAAAAWAAPGVTARELGANADGEMASEWAVSEPSWDAGKVERASWESNGEGWLAIRGSRLTLNPGFSVRLTGMGRIGFREWGRAFDMPDGYHAYVNGEHVDERDVCESEQVTIVGPSGEVAWTLTPVRRDARRQAVRVNVAALTDAQVRAVLSEAKLDAALDTIIEAWARDPQAVRAAAQRIARTFDRDFAARFEQLGVEVGRELAPQLERVTNRLGRDLTPEFGRLGAELGRSIATALTDGVLADVELGAGSGDFRKPKPKHN